MGGPYEPGAVFVPQVIDRKRERAAGPGFRVEARRKLYDVGLLLHAGDLHQIQNVLAVTLFKWAVDEVGLGRRILSAGDDCSGLRRLAMPSLDRAYERAKSQDVAPGG
jgi:hypothetical protein